MNSRLAVVGNFCLRIFFTCSLIFRGKSSHSNFPRTLYLKNLFSLISGFPILVSVSFWFRILGLPNNRASLALFQTT